MAKALSEFIRQYRQPGQCYVEPFVGAASVLLRMDGMRLASDRNKYIVALLCAVRDGWVPPDTISEEQYDHIKANKAEYPDYLVGFVGFGCSFGGGFFRGYARASKCEDFCGQAKESLLKAAPLLRGVDIVNCDYDALRIPPKSMIYCDPPYADTKRYSHETFDSDRFFAWCRAMFKKGHTVFVSEYDAPFDCVFEKPRTSTMRSGEGMSVAERLYLVR